MCVIIFAGNNEAEVPLFFAGGPVISVAWCPTLVSQTEDQILAVSTLSSMNVVPKLKDATSDSGLIQLWNLGKMKNIITSVKTPHFFMGLGHTWGVVREIAWCPSGCQSPQYHGLLAAACGDGTVRLVPIPRHNDNQLFFHAKVYNLTFFFFFFLQLLIYL
jgi:WD40 repeat protein